MHEEEEHYVPERDWWKRTYPTVLIPKPIVGEYHEIRKRFGIDIANLVLLAYREWGRDVAKSLARRILAFRDHEELFRFLVSRIDLFDERSRRILSSTLQVYRYNHYVDELIFIASERERECPGVREKSLSLYHQLAIRGHFYTPDCVVLYSVRMLGCKDVSLSDPRCKRVFENLVRILGDKP